MSTVPSVAGCSACTDGTVGGCTAGTCATGYSGYDPALDTCTENNCAAYAISSPIVAAVTGGDACTNGIVLSAAHDDAAPAGHTTCNLGCESGFYAAGAVALTCAAARDGLDAATTAIACTACNPMGSDVPSVASCQECFDATVGGCTTGTCETGYGSYNADADIPVCTVKSCAAYTIISPIAAVAGGTDDCTNSIALDAVDDTTCNLGCVPGYYAVDGVPVALTCAAGSDDVYVATTAIACVACWHNLPTNIVASVASCDRCDRSGLLSGCTAATCAAGYNTYNAADGTCTENHCAAYTISDPIVAFVTGGVDDCTNSIALGAVSDTSCNLGCASGHYAVGGVVALTCAAATDGEPADTAIACTPCNPMGSDVPSVASCDTCPLGGEVADCTAGTCAVDYHTYDPVHSTCSPCYGSAAVGDPLTCSATAWAGASLFHIP